MESEPVNPDHRHRSLLLIRAIMALYSWMIPEGKSRAIFLKLTVAGPLFYTLWLTLAPQMPLVERLENLSVDLRFRTRAPFDPPCDPRLIVVGLDEPSLSHFGRWPWPRAVHGDFCQLLSINPPAATAWDILFVDPGDTEGDSALA